MPHFFAGSAITPCSFKITISARLFLALPSSVSFDATGAVSAYPAIDNLSRGTPNLVDSSSRIAILRAADNSQLL